MPTSRERPLGYSTTAPPEAFATAGALARNPGDQALLRRLGRAEEAAAAYCRARDLAANPAERAFLERRLAELASA